MYRELLVMLTFVWAFSLTTVVSQEKVDPEIVAKMKKRNHQWAAANQAKANGDFATAIKSGETVLEIERKLFQDDNQELISTVKFLAQCEEGRENWMAAKMRRTEVLNRTLKLYGETNYRVTDARLAVRNVDVLQQLTPEQRRLLNQSLVLEQDSIRLNREGNYAPARKLAQDNVRIRELILGPDDPATANSFNNLALLYKFQGNYAAAEPLYQRALTIREKSLGLDHPDTAQSLNNLGVLYQSQGNYAAAEALHQRALKIREKALGPDHPHTANSLNNLAGLYNSKANYAAAEPLYQRALKIREKALEPDHPDTAQSLNSLGVLYQFQGNYAAAEALHQRALKIREKAVGLDHPDTATSLNNLAEFYRFQGNYAAAEPLYLRALKIWEKSLGPDHPHTATSLNNLAEFYRFQGNYAAAEPLYLRALKIWEKSLGPDHPETANALNNLALLYKSQGNYDAAEPLYQHALKIWEKSLGPDHPYTATSLNNLARLYEDQANYAAAEPHYQRALKMREKALGPDHLDTAQSLNNLAMLYWERDPAQAAPLAMQATDIQLRHLDATAVIQSEQQQFLMSRQVESCISVWLTVSQWDPQPTSAVYRDVLAWKGMITARQQGLRQSLKDDPLFAQFRQVTQRLSTVTLSPPLPPADPKQRDAWKVQEPELRRQWESEKAKLTSEHEQLEHDLAPKSVAFRQNLQRRRVKVEDLIAALKSQAKPTALVDILEYGYQPRKTKGEKYERRLVAFIVLADKPMTRVELGSGDAITQSVQRWREYLGTNATDQDSGTELRKLVWLPLEEHLQGIETVLISPDGALAQLPWGALPGSKEGTYLLEERALAVIPVPQMLPALLEKPHRAGPPESLLLAGDIEYGGDAGQPQDLLTKRDAAGRLRDGRILQFGKLPAAQSELSSIKDWYENADDTGTVMTLRKMKATENAFREQAAQHQWLHLITHGYFAPTEINKALHESASNPATASVLNRAQIAGVHPGLLSGLAFAGANTPPEAGKDDGILTALEVAVLDLNRVDTVVLSACETGLGEVARGEGLLGLQRAFQVSGAKTCVASLWKVPDSATARLMQRFYENLWDKKMGKLEALREAQIWMLRDDSNRGLTRVDQPLPKQSDKGLSPYYWAAFVLSGDWR